MATTSASTADTTYQPFSDSFDNGLSNWPDTWNVDTSVAGQVTLHAEEYYLSSGMMEATGSASMGHGYGTYTVNAALYGGINGSAVMLWNSLNDYPLSEIDFAETIEDGSGRQYAALHWSDNGQDRFTIQYYDTDIRPGTFHEYQVVWEPGKLTMKVDGEVQAVFTDHVPKDAAHGGVNHVFAFLNTKPETSLVVRDVSYVPLDGYGDGQGTTQPATGGGTTTGGTASGGGAGTGGGTTGGSAGGGSGGGGAGGGTSTGGTSTGGTATGGGTAGGGSSGGGATSGGTTGGGTTTPTDTGATSGGEATPAANAAPAIAPPTPPPAGIQIDFYALHAAITGHHDVTGSWSVPDDLTARFAATASDHMLF